MNQQLSNLFDDAIENGDFATVKNLTEKGVTSEILTEAMDTAYRGTQIDPPVQSCFEMVEYFKNMGIPVPTYEFNLTKM